MFPFPEPKKLLTLSQVLEDYDSQLSHLSKELGSITEEFEGLTNEQGRY